MTRPTVHDVARTAGVSLSTVDRVLNGREGVRSATEKRVKAAIQQLGYERNVAAANLSRKRQYRLRFFLPSGPNSFMRGLEIEIEAQAQRIGFIELSIITTPAFDDGALIAALRKIRPDEIDGVGIVATESPLARASIAELRASGIKVITLVSDLPSSQRQYFVGIDNVHAGRTAASLLGRFCRGKAGRIAIVAGSMLVRDHADRRLGFEQVLRTEFPEQEVLPPIEGYDDQDIAGRKLTELLRQTPNIIGVYSLGAGNRGIARVISALPAQRRPRVVAHELTSFSREALLDGTFDAVIHQDRTREAEAAIRLLILLIDGTQNPDDSHRIGIEIFLRDNLP